MSSRAIILDLGLKSTHFAGGKSRKTLSRPCYLLNGLVLVLLCTLDGIYDDRAVMRGDKVAVAVLFQGRG